MVEYRLEDLAQISGVSARNIRAYRERGLLDSPRRVGRSAYYDERHLAQLKAITQLLAKGFNSAHIAEFFAALRRGQDLADALGISGSQWREPVPRLGLDPTDEDVRALVACGLAHAVGDGVELDDPELVTIVSGADDRRSCIRVLAHIARSTAPAVDTLATATARAVAEGQGGEASPELARTVVSAGLRRALRAALSDAE